VIYIDGIIGSLQKYGGVSVYFSELIDLLEIEGLNFKFGQYCPQSWGPNLAANRVQCASRLFERYRSAVTPDTTKLFHSSYYRMPDRIDIPSITTVHDFTYEYFSSGLKRKVHSQQKLKAIKNASAVICISQNTKKDLLRFAPETREDKIVVIPNGVNDTFKQITNYNEFEKYTLFVGARDGYKDFDTAVMATSYNSGVKLVMVGGGMLSKKHKVLLDSMLPGRYHHISDIDVDGLNKIYNNAICLIYPSHYEGFGIPVVEAMRAGCPVIARNSSSISEVSGNAGLLVSTNNKEDWIDAIAACMKPNERGDMVEKGIINSLKYSWRTTHAQTIELYKKVIAT
jgi:mannosyltransferase